MAVITVAYCPRCQSELNRSDKIVFERIVVACIKCKIIALEYDDAWFSGTYEECMASLRGRVQEIQRYNDMLRSDWEDPRWERLQ
jgi:hypothetical protein